VGAHSPSLRAADELGELETVLGTGVEYESRDPVNLAATSRGLRRVQIWIDAGEEDPWLERVEVLHQTLEARGIDHEWNVLPGEHSGEYWQRNMVTYLRFYDRVLNWRFMG
jgi:enterochelin esterase-like enzyme